MVENTSTQDYSKQDAIFSSCTLPSVVRDILNVIVRKSYLD